MFPFPYLSISLTTKHNLQHTIPHRKVFDRYPRPSGWYRKTEKEPLFSIYIRERFIFIRNISRQKNPLFVLPLPKIKELQMEQSQMNSSWVFLKLCSANTKRRTKKKNSSRRISGGGIATSPGDLLYDMAFRK